MIENRRGTVYFAVNEVSSSNILGAQMEFILHKHISYAKDNDLCLREMFDPLNEYSQLTRMFFLDVQVDLTFVSFHFSQDVGDLEYSRVYFSYPTRPDIPVLRGLDLNILGGKTVALVGSSGCGKSTIIQLLERFYNPTAGEVCVDDVDIRIMDLQHLRSHFGIVSQEPNLFDRTIAENIAYGNNQRTVPMSEIIEAAKNANIHNFVISLPKVNKIISSVE